ncbi:hypothetical protein EVAR_97894_1 [Eumeta japonica]|uniref:Uncharacterized protein n=1 Tax=Eumeta variegata TaxID=151549 RepID=A0A4C1WHJ2_EUMVA|nr:hypothetical protein EVAR_97894_1 [Eumeta japonica]
MASRVPPFDDTQQVTAAFPRLFWPAPASVSYLWSRAVQQLASRWHWLYRRYCECVIPLFAPQSGDSCLLRVSAIRRVHTLGVARGRAPEELLFSHVTREIYRSVRVKGTRPGKLTPNLLCEGRHVLSTNVYLEWFHLFYTGVARRGAGARRVPVSPARDGVPAHGINNSYRDAIVFHVIYKAISPTVTATYQRVNLFDFIVTRYY